MTVYRIGEIPYDEDSFFVTPDYKTWLKFYPNEEIHKITTNKLYLPLRNKSFSSFDELRNKYEKGEFTEDDVAYINPEESGIQHFEQYEIKPDDIIDLEQIDLEEGTCGYDTDVKTGKKLDTPGGLEEGKQVGILYHYTSADGLKGILSSNSIKASEEIYMGQNLYYVSFTRNKNFHKKGSKFGVKTEYRITLDGDKLSNKYKITPHSYKPGYDYTENWEYDWLEDEPENVVRDFFAATGDYDEQEERISFKGPEGGIDNIKNYILSVDKVEDLQETLNDPFGLNEYAKTLVKEALIETWNPKESFVSLSRYMIDNGMNIKPLPKIKVIKDDEQNASDLLGKTAYYNPVEKSITLYTMDRHPKDVLRSFAHEMIHHEQNLDGRLNNINTTNTNEDGDLPEIEKEAYEKGNMMLRNWEDKIKNV